MEELTKTQIVLLTLLVSFVTSIATGIVTVSLMDQAPEAVTQTINRVVEHTVERVVPVEVATPAPSKTTASAVTAVREVVTVIKDENAVPEAIKKNTRGIAQLSQLKDLTGEGYERFYVGIALVVTKEGRLFVNASLPSAGLFEATFFDGKKIQYHVKEGSPHASLLEPVKQEVYTFNPVNIGDSSGAVLGQSVITLSGRSDIKVARGIVESITGVSASSPEEKALSVSAVTGDTVIGAPLVDLAGNVIAVRIVSEEKDGKTFIGIAAFAELLKEKKGI